MMSNLDMIIASIDDSPYVLGIALNSIIGRKILSGGNNKKGDNIVDTLYLPNGLVQTPNNIIQDSKIIVNSSNLHDNDVLSDDLYNKLLELADIRQSVSDTLTTEKKSGFLKGLSKQTNTKPRVSITEKNKNSKNSKNSKNKNVTRNNKNK